MTGTTDEGATVLVADDEPDLVELYADYLEGGYEVLTAVGGEEALALLEERDVDVALLDRRMPDLHGDTVLATVLERSIEVRVALVTAVDPDFDIIDLGCDAYLAKPVDRDEVRGVVERLLAISEYSEKHAELTSKKLTRNVLEIEKSRHELEESDRFARLEAEIERLEDELDEIESGLDLRDVRRHI